MTQADRLRAHLESGQAITRLECHTLLGIAAPSLGRIVQHVESKGYPVKRERAEVLNFAGERVVIARYLKG